MKKKTKERSWKLISFKLLSGDDAEETPVPIPNTAVKLCSAENTWWATAREHRKPLRQILLNSSVGRALGC